MLGQLGKHPAALGTVAVLLLMFGLVPGLPVYPSARCTRARRLHYYGAQAGKREAAAALQEVQNTPDLPQTRTMGDVLDLDDTVNLHRSRG